MRVRAGIFAMVANATRKVKTVTVCDIFKNLPTACRTSSSEPEPLEQKHVSTPCSGSTKGPCNYGSRNTGLMYGIKKLPFVNLMLTVQNVLCRIYRTGFSLLMRSLYARQVQLRFKKRGGGINLHTYTHT
jgi:hypothetical protein